MVWLRAPAAAACARGPRRQCLFTSTAGDWAGKHRICQARRHRAPARQFVRKTENVMVQRMEAAFVMLRQKLRLACGHVHLHGTLRLHALQLRQRSRASWTASLPKPSLCSAPASISRAAARGRVWNASPRRSLDSWDTSRPLGLAARTHANATFGSALKGTAVGGEGEVRFERLMRFSVPAILSVRRFSIGS